MLSTESSEPAKPLVQQENAIATEDLISKNPPIVKGCFIATAALGSELHPHVQSLREFRDNILLRSKYKNTFESLLDKYYKFSPPIARAMDRNLFLKISLRYTLVYPVVFSIKGILPIVDVILGIKRNALQSLST